MRHFMTEYEVAQYLGLTLKECATLREWKLFPEGRRLEGICLALYGAADVERFYDDTRLGGRLYATVEYILGALVET